MIIHVGHSSWWLKYKFLSKHCHSVLDHWDNIQNDYNTLIDFCTKCSRGLTDEKELFQTVIHGLLWKIWNSYSIYEKMILWLLLQKLMCDIEDVNIGKKAKVQNDYFISFSWKKKKRYFLPSCCKGLSGIYKVPFGRFLGDRERK